MTNLAVEIRIPEPWLNGFVAEMNRRDVSVPSLSKEDIVGAWDIIEDIVCSKDDGNYTWPWDEWNQAPDTGMTVSTALEVIANSRPIFRGKTHGDPNYLPLLEAIKVTVFFDFGGIVWGVMSSRCIRWIRPGVLCMSGTRDDAKIARLRESRRQRAQLEQQ